MSRLLFQFVTTFASDDGSDLIEYTLILATIILAGAALFLGMQASANTIWSAANNQLGVANN